MTTVNGSEHGFRLENARQRACNTDGNTRLLKLQSIRLNLLLRLMQEFT